MRPRTAVRALALRAAGALLLAAPVAAHGGSLSATQEPVSVPGWLMLLTGGGVVGASFLLTSFVTDRGLVGAVHRAGVALPARPLRRSAGSVVRAASVAALVVVVAAGLFGPQEATRNFAVLFVWVGWWAGYTMTTYLVGNSWPSLDPWRALASRLPERDRLDYPDRLGAWPSVAGLLALVWIEVVSPVTEQPRLLAGLVVAYTAVTLAGAAAFGADTWFDRVDPISRVFRAYGRVAPVRRTGDGLELGLPGGRSAADPATGRDGVAFVVALLWVTTYDGLVSTAAGAGVTRAVVAAGVPPLLWYLGVLLAGFAAFLAAYRLAAAFARRTAGTYVAAREIERRFAPTLLPIAAGYHLAHFLGYFLSLSPALLAVAAAPLSPPEEVLVLATPGWFAGVALAAVLVGHLVAVWTSHATSFELFPGRLQPIRSQYPFVVLLIGYTITSLWIVVQPYTPPPAV